AAAVAAPRHVQRHGAGPEAALAVAASVIEAHGGLGMGGACQQRGRGRGLAGREGGQGVQAAFHGGQPAVAAHGDATRHLGQRPLAGLSAGRVVAPQAARGDVGPVERLLGGMPYRAFPDLAQHVAQPLGLPRRVHDQKGPALTNAPPWYCAAGSSGPGAGCASTAARKRSEESLGSKPRWRAAWLSHQRSRLAEAPYTMVWPTLGVKRERTTSWVRSS